MEGESKQFVKYKSRIDAKLGERLSGIPDHEANPQISAKFYLTPQSLQNWNFVLPVSFYTNVTIHYSRQI